VARAPFPDEAVRDAVRVVVKPDDVAEVVHLVSEGVETARVVEGNGRSSRDEHAVVVALGRLVDADDLAQEVDASQRRDADAGVVEGREDAVLQAIAVDVALDVAPVADHPPENRHVPHVGRVRVRVVDLVKAGEIPVEAVLVAVLHPEVAGDTAEIVDAAQLRFGGAGVVEGHRAAVLPAEPVGQAVGVEIAADDGAEVVHVGRRREGRSRRVDRREMAVVKQETVRGAAGVHPAPDDVAQVVVPEGERGRGARVVDGGEGLGEHGRHRPKDQKSDGGPRPEVSEKSGKSARMCGLDRHHVLLTRRLAALVDEALKRPGAGAGRRAPRRAAP